MTRSRREGAPGSRREGAPRSRRESTPSNKWALHALHLAGATAVLSLAIYLLRPLLYGWFPVSSDHMVHLYQAWDLWENRLVNGRLSGWSDYWFFGYPAGDLYHPGLDIWVAMFRAGTLARLDWGQTYGLAFLAYFAFAGLAIYRFGQRHMGLAAGLAGSFLWMLDRGEYEQGGWLYLVRAGVWGQGLGLALFLLGLGFFLQALQGHRARDHALAGMFLGASILAHPMDLLLLLMALPALLLLKLLLIPARKAPRTLLLSSAWIVGTCFLVASTWLLPLWTRYGWTEAVGKPWLPASAILRGLLNGDLFTGTSPLVIYAGLLGGLLGFLRRRLAPALLFLLMLILLATASTDVLYGLRLQEHFPSVGRIQFQRFTIPAKACLFLLAGYTLDEIWRSLWCFAGWQKMPTLFRKMARPTLAVSTALALLVSAFTWWQPFLAYTARLDLPCSGSSETWPSYQIFNRWALEQHEAEQGFYRIAYEGREYDQDFMAAPVFNQTAGYKSGFTSCRIFSGVTGLVGDELYRALSVKYVASRQALNRPTLQFHRRFGEILVYRFVDYQPNRYKLLPGQDAPSPKVETLEFNDQQVRFALSGTGIGSRLRLYVANYERWAASMNGQKITIESASPARGVAPIVMEVPITDGELRFRYVRRGVDWLSMATETTGLLLVLALLLRGRRPPWGTETTSRAPRHQQIREKSCQKSL